MNAASAAPARDRNLPDRMATAWLVSGAVFYVIAALVVYRPGAEGADLVVAIGAPVAFVAMLLAFWLHPVRRPVASLAATLLHTAAWGALIFANDAWTIASFVVYALCFRSGRRLGVVLSAIVSLLWAAAWMRTDAPTFALLVPFGVFGAASLLSLTIYRIDAANAEQALLIAELEQSQRDLAASEHARGVLEERSRLAAEIHDTLAQGFTSIVLLARAARRSAEVDDVLDTIEETAQGNLDAARRLVAEGAPAELAERSLAEAVRRQVDALGGVAASLHVDGRSRALPGSVQVTVLRAAQVALANVEQHAAASRVDVTLSYLDDAVVLDVRDDGVGFVDGEIADRGPLTGGHGLGLLAARVESTGGVLTVETAPGAGCVMSAHIPLTA